MSMQTRTHSSCSSAVSGSGHATFSRSCSRRAATSRGASLAPPRFCFLPGGTSTSTPAQERWRWVQRQGRRGMRWHGAHRQTRRLRQTSCETPGPARRRTGHPDSYIPLARLQVETLRSPRPQPPKDPQSIPRHEHPSRAHGVLRGVPTCQMGLPAAICGQGLQTLPAIAEDRLFRCLKTRLPQARPQQEALRWRQRHPPPQVRYWRQRWSACWRQRLALELRRRVRTSRPP